MKTFEPWKAENILNFVDLDFDPAVRYWIVQNTGQAVPANTGKSQMNQKMLNRKRSVITKHDKPFATKRIASTILERWPQEMSYEVVRDIEAGCADLLQTFGYKKVGSESEYANKSRTYLPDLPNE